MKWDWNPFSFLSSNDDNQNGEAQGAHVRGTETTILDLPPEVRVIINPRFIHHFCKMDTKGKYMLFANAYKYVIFMYIDKILYLEGSAGQ